MVHDQLGKTITLPADYVSNTVQLGYATTVHGAQGITTGTCHVVLTGDEDRNLLYVALSRGKFANHLYLNVASDGDPHNLIRPEALIPPTALDRIAEMLRRDGSPVSATTTLREQTNPHQLLGDMAARYHDAVTAGAENLIGPVGMDKIDAHAEALLTGLTEAPAWPTLRSHLALIALDEHSPLKLLTARRRRRFAGRRTRPRRGARRPRRRPRRRTHRRPATRPEHSPAATDGPLPWLPGIPARLAEAHDWGPFAAAYHQLVREQIDAVREQARDWTGATAPVWAQPFLEDEDTDLRAELAVWRAVAGTDENDLRPTGDRTIGAPGAYQAKLNRAVRTGTSELPLLPAHLVPGAARDRPRRPVDHPAVPATRPPRTRRAARDRLHHRGAQDRPLRHRPASPAPTRTPRLPRGRCPTSTRPPRCGGASFRTSGRLRSAPTSTPRTCCSPHGAPRWPNSSAPPRPTTCRSPRVARARRGR